MFLGKNAFRCYAIEAFGALTLLGVSVRLSRTLVTQIADPTIHAVVTFCRSFPSVSSRWFSRSISLSTR